jgi:hypothetical protein
MTKVKDGLILAYVKNEEVYPVVLSEENRGLLQYMCKVFEPIVVIDESMGKAVYLSEDKEKNCEV